MQLTAKKLKDYLNNVSDDTLVSVVMTSIMTPEAQVTNDGAVYNLQIMDIDRVDIADNVVRKYLDGELISQKNNSYARIFVGPVKPK